MEKLDEIQVVQKPLANPKLTKFGSNIPSRVTFIRVCENVTEKTLLSSGDKIARHMTVHWENHDANVNFNFNVKTGEMKFKLPAIIGNFFSVSWTINDEILQEFKTDRIISFGFEECDLGRKNPIGIFGNLNLIKAKNHGKQICTVGYYENRLQATFSMDDQSELWKSATRGWMDIVFSETNMRTITIKQPMIWVQSKMKL